jgi:Uma2 family endonuclease
MASQPKPRYTPEEYLAIEREAEFKNEYLDGEIIAMVGASEPHNLIVVNLVTELANQLKRRPCKIYASDMRVDLRERYLFAYPDVVVVCGDASFRIGEMDNLLNPTLIIEVLSKSTEGYDRGMKFIKYRRIESLQEYLLVAQDEPRIEQYIRQPSKEWLLSEFNGLDTIAYLPSIECHLTFKEVYDKVGFPE